MQPSTSSTPRAVIQRLEQLLENPSREALLQAFQEPELNALIPGLNQMAGCEHGRNLHLEGDVAVHTALVVETIIAIAPGRLGRPADFVERLGALIHDKNKPDTRQEGPDGSVSFPGHEVLAARDVPAIGLKLGLKPDDIARLEFIVAQHMAVHEITQLPAEIVNPIRQSPYRLSLALLQEADARSCILPGNKHLPVFWDQIV